jgi:enamine deaminase RidA (YjgF/YER057c/UK114 family)
VRVHIERRIAELGLVLPEPLTPPPGVELPFPFVRIRGTRAFVSGHGPLNPDGSIAGPFGKVGADLTPEQANKAAELTGLAMLSSLRAALGDLDRVTAWLRVFGMVNTAPGFTATPAVINGFSELILRLWGPENGAHARSAVGLAALPFDLPVEIEAEVEIST